MEKKGIGHLNDHIWLLMDDGDAPILYYWFILLPIHHVILVCARFLSSFVDKIDLIHDISL